MTDRRRMRIAVRWLRSPVSHWILIGGLLFVFVRATGPPEQADRPRIDRKPIVISADQIRLRQSQFGEKWGFKPTKEQRRALIAQAVEDEMLYREARVLALGYKDGSVRRRLIEKMRVVSDRPGRSREELYRKALALGLDDDVIIRRLLIQKMRTLLQQNANGAPLHKEEVQHYIERNRQSFLQPATVSFTHVFLSERRGDRIGEEARKALEQLRFSAGSDDAVAALSDPFALGLEFRRYPKSRITARFGHRFAEEVFNLEPPSWSGPFVSPYGHHLVRIDEKQPPKMPPLEAIWHEAAYRLAKQRAAKRLEEGLARLRNLYEIRIENTDGASVD